MRDPAELERLARNMNGELPPAKGGFTVRVTVTSRGDPSLSLGRVREVLSAVSRQDSDAWPTVQEWLRLLPAWFTEPFRSRTLADVIVDENLWTFGSWTDAMRWRGWWWWSARLATTGWDTLLLAYELPYSVGPLEYLIRASGASVAEIEES